MVQSSEGTRVIALGLCREFEDKFLQHIAGGEVSDGDAHPRGLSSLRFTHDIMFIFCEN